MERVLSKFEGLFRKAKPTDYAYSKYEESAYPEYDKFESMKLVDAQVIHDPLQVKNPTELQVGKVYIQMHRGTPSSVKLKVTGISGHWFEADDIYENGSAHRNEHSMADRGIIPYNSGILWNPWNYLIPEESLNMSEGMKSLFG